MMEKLGDAFKVGDCIDVKLVEVGVFGVKERKYGMAEYNMTIG